MYFSKKINSPIGMLYLVSTKNALISIDNIQNELYQMAVSSNSQEILNNTQKQLDEYFESKRTSFDLPLAPAGTPFQLKVWEALMNIPYGQTWSYGEQAGHLKMPQAARAVGGANGKNPIPIIIPCHRVIGSTGKLTGYSGGMEMKINLLKHEGHLLSGLKITHSA